MLVTLSVLMTSSCSHSQNGFLVLEGPYLGQKQPGLTPEVFAPGIVSTEHEEWGSNFTSDLKKFYFNRQGGKYKKSTTLIIQYKDNQWIESVAPETDPLRGNPFISPDGKTLHFGKRYKERTDAGWSEMKNLGAPYEDIGIMTLTVSSKGTYVFDERGTDGDGLLRYSRLVDGKREAPRLFSNEINTGLWTAHAKIAPDESYIIWDSERDGGYGETDMYISFRAADGSWGAAINFGDKINTAGNDSGGYITPDGKYLFFGRNTGSKNSENYDIFWVDAQIIETLRPKP